MASSSSPSAPTQALDSAALVSTVAFGNDDPRLELAHKLLDEAATVAMNQFPVLKQLFVDVLIETVFVPQVILKQLVLLIALEAGWMTVQQVSSLVQRLLSNFDSRQRLIRQLQQEQQQASTQDEWMDLAERIDAIQFNDVWRSDPNCPLYERDRISARMNEYVHLMRRNDIFELMFVLRGSIGRNKFGLLHEGLFSKALAGTKVLVETYHTVVCAALEFVCDAQVLEGEDAIPTDARLAFFNETRHAYGRTALLLSGGASLGFYHCGVVKTLIQNRLMPRVIGGSSAGSILCAMVGTRTNEECMNDMFEGHGTDAPGHSGKLPLNFFRPLQRNDIPMHQSAGEDGSTTVTPTNAFSKVYYNTAGAFYDAKRTLQGLVPIPLRHCSSLIFDLICGNRKAQDLFKNDTAHFRKCVRTCVGDFTFQEAFDRTGRILNIVVTPQNSSDPPRLLNYLTAPHVLVWSAAVASSSLPGVFEANRLVVKEADGWERYESGGSGQAFSDGSMEQDLPMEQLSEMFNVNHFIISQANPHAVMFASYSEKVSVWTHPLTGMVNSILTFLKGQIRSWLAHLIEVLGARRITPLFQTQRGVGSQFFTQEYQGRPCDISLIPWQGHRSLLSALLHIIYNPSHEEFVEWVNASCRETWKHLPAIKSHIAEEVTLEECIQKLRKRLIVESWEKANNQTKNTYTNTKASSSKYHSRAANTSQMGNRVPSFFTSPSLVNLGGLAISEPPTLSLNASQSSNLNGAAAAPPSPRPPIVPVHEVDVNAGWGGMGLRGNRSTGSLGAQSSTSGLFIDAEDEEQAVVAASPAPAPVPETSTLQNAGEETTGNSSMIKTSFTSLKASGINASSNHSTAAPSTDGYIKTTTMARFYYRNARKTSSFSALDKLGDDSGLQRQTQSSQATGLLKHARRKSRSDAALSSMLLDGLSSAAAPRSLALATSDEKKVNN